MPSAPVAGPGAPPRSPPMSPSEPPPAGERGVTRRRVAVWLLQLVLVLLLSAGVALLVPVVQRILHPDPAQQSLVQARRIYNACQAFAAVRGRLPSNLEELVPDFLPDQRALADPAHPESGEIGYLYYGSGSTGTEPPQSPFLAGKGAPAGGRVIVQFDGTARLEGAP
jgi:hypothetical protein